MNTKGIYLPNGFMPIGAGQAAKAVEDYDSDLGLARHNDTGEWVVYKMSGPNGRPHPVLSLGYGEVPSRDAILAKLHRFDTKRRGAEIVREVVRNNDKVQAEARRKAREAAGETAEQFEHIYRKFGLHEWPRVFVPKDVPSDDR